MTVTRSSPSTSPNCVIREDQRGARLSKPDKNLLRRIDAAVAAVMAFARFMPLPSPVAETLKHHWTAQAAERPAAPVWTPWEEHPDLVFPTQMGTPTDSTKAVRAFGSIANRAGLVGVGLHTLMHSAASALIASGAHLKVVQELLGRSSYGITADIYSHVALEQQRGCGAAQPDVSVVSFVTAVVTAVASPRLTVDSRKGVSLGLSRSGWRDEI